MAKKKKPLKRKKHTRANPSAASTPRAAAGGVGGLAELMRLAVLFRDERDWKQFHNPKDMALSMSLEVGEILELMQWKNGEALRQHLHARRDDLADELSDVLYWVLTIAHDFGIDPSAAFREKLEKSARKYPIHKSLGRADKYTVL